MQPYNVKVLTYPDLTKRYMIYKTTIGAGPGYAPKEKETEISVFDGARAEVLHMDIESYKFNLVDEVSIKRTRKKVYDYAACNEWDWFVTFTFDKRKVDRHDYDDCVKKLSKWLNNLRRTSPELSYLVVPERHQDGAYHFHGLVSGLSSADLVWSGKYVVKRVKTAGRDKFVRTNDKIYKIGRYKLGWMTATQVRDRDRVVGYVTKYITKHMLYGLMGRKRYWASRGLQVPMVETFNLDDVDRFILRAELENAATYATASSFSYGSVEQVVNVFDCKD